MFALLSLPAPSMPYGYLWEILFAAVLAFSLVLAIKYPSFGKRWALLLLLVGVAEFEFSSSTYNGPHYSPLVLGMLVGLFTAYSGILIPMSYWAKQHFRNKQVKILFVVSGFLELMAGCIGVFYRIGGSVVVVLVYLGMLAIGFYSLIVGLVSFYLAKPKRQPRMNQ